MVKIYSEIVNSEELYGIKDDKSDKIYVTAKFKYYNDEGSVIFLHNGKCKDNSSLYQDIMYISNGNIINRVNPYKEGSNFYDEVGLATIKKGYGYCYITKNGTILEEIYRDFDDVCISTKKNMCLAICDCGPNAINYFDPKALAKTDKKFLISAFKQYLMSQNREGFSKEENEEYIKNQLNNFNACYDAKIEDYEELKKSTDNTAYYTSIENIVK